MSDTSVKLTAALTGAFPPGVPERLADGPGSPLAHLGAIGSTVADLVPYMDTLQASATPLTASADRIVEWERQLDLPIAKGTLAGRQNGVISRLRERGSMTRGKIRAVLGPLLDITPANLEVIGPDRDAQRSAHTYVYSGSVSITSSNTGFQIYVADDAYIGEAGAVLDITLTHTDLSKVIVTLSTPEGYTGVKRDIGQGSVTGETIRLYFNPKDTNPDVMLGQKVGGVTGGNWFVQIRDDGTGGTLTDASLFVEGLGRDSALNDGLAAGVFGWAVVADPAKMGVNADIPMTREAIERINYATRIGGIIIPNDAFGTVGAVPGEAIPGDTIPDE